MPNTSTIKGKMVAAVNMFLLVDISLTYPPLYCRLELLGRTEPIYLI